MKAICNCKYKNDCHIGDGRQTVNDMSDKCQMANPVTPPKMSLEEFKQKIDGCVNDFIEYVTDEEEFRTAIMDVMIEVMDKCLDKQ